MRPLGIDLQKLSSRMSSADLKTCFQRFLCTLVALAQLRQPLVHHDLKPENIMYGTDHTIRLLDVGLADRLRLHAKKANQGTKRYQIPMWKSTGANCDLWASGVTMMELALCKAHPKAVEKFGQGDHCYRLRKLWDSQRKPCCMTLGSTL